MIRPWHLAPVLAAAALAAAAYWWHSERNSWRAPAARRPELPSVEPMPQPARASVHQALERPLLWSARRPVQTDEKPGGLARELTQSRLTAVFESGRERVAVLLRADGSSFKITGQTRPWRLENFDGRTAGFVSADGERVERLLEPGAPTPRADPRRPTEPPRSVPPLTGATPP
ncbi:hypothetical protein [Verminephrobacter aporrectodeae]|uniref:hypothetical protein n=2 Tax=Verminephrobacter aporrectodeae TaxID=1110389 RepID=UPI002243B075|nr:hypothetical protein [Verminephrobacter aporrectodeae]